MSQTAHNRFIATHERSIALLDLHKRLSKVTFIKQPKTLPESQLADLVSLGSTVIGILLPE
jgi:hypothetical protein